MEEESLVGLLNLFYHRAYLLYLRNYLVYVRAFGIIKFYFRIPDIKITMLNSSHVEKST